jgi:hypothetical protein
VTVALPDYLQAADQARALAEHHATRAARASEPGPALHAARQAALAARRALNTIHRIPDTDQGPTATTTHVMAHSAAAHALDALDHYWDLADGQDTSDEVVYVHDSDHAEPDQRQDQQWKLSVKALRSEVITPAQQGGAEVVEAHDPLGLSWIITYPDGRTRYVAIYQA